MLNFLTVTEVLFLVLLRPSPQVSSPLLICTDPSIDPMFLLLLLSVSLLPNLTPRLPLSFCDFLQLFPVHPTPQCASPLLSPLIPQHAIRFPYTTPLVLIFALPSFVSLCPSYFIFSQFSFYVWHFFFSFRFLQRWLLGIMKSEEKGIIGKERSGHLTKTSDGIQTQCLEIHFLTI